MFQNSGEVLKKSMTIESSEFCREKFVGYLRKVLYREVKTDREAKLQDFLKSVLTGYRAEMNGEQEEHNSYLKEFFSIISL